MGTIISNISKMKVISYSVALLLVVAVAVQAADVEFCHISVTNAATSIKGKIGTAMTGAITYPGCMTLANVDTSATMLSILDASDDSEIATGALDALVPAANGANYVAAPAHLSRGQGCRVHQPLHEQRPLPQQPRCVRRLPHWRHDPCLLCRKRCCHEPHHERHPLLRGRPHDWLRCR